LVFFGAIRDFMGRLLREDGKLKTLRISLVLMAFLLVVSAPSLAQVDDDTAVDDDAVDDDAVDDDVGEFEATVEFSGPEALGAAADYEFTFRVTNTTTPGEMQRWIWDVEMYMPNSGYDLDAADLTAPTPLHNGEWEVDPLDDDGVAGIRWQYTGVATSEAYGDIREGEHLDFSFNAMTDEDATDGFPWRLLADTGEQLQGTSYVGGEPDDDTEDDDTADDDASAGDDDDDDGGGCGC